MGHWEFLAAFAWDRYLALGRGAVILSRKELLADRDPVDADSKETNPLAPGYVPIEYVPKGDDFRALMHQYEPRSELLLVVSDPDEEEMLLRLQSDGETRPGPERCWTQSDFATARE